MDVSNRTLAVLLFLAMAVSLAGTLVAVAKMNSLSMSGYATNPNATAQLTIANTLSIKFSVATIDWGSGYVNGSSNECNLTTSDVGAAPYSGCVGFVSPAPAPLTLENDGNVVANVTVKLNQTPAQWIGDSGAQAWINVAEKETGSCTLNLLTGLQSISTTELRICERFQYANANDELNIGMKVLVPNTAPPGTKVTEVNAVATAAS